jgi:hypothetical protein
MTRSALLTGLLAAVLAVAPATAQQFPIPLRFVTADGTWDCKGKDGMAIGTVIIVESAYSFINTDSKVDGYGKLHRVSEGLVDLPNYIVIDGPLKDRGIAGSVMRGQVDDYEDYSDGIFLMLFTADNTSTYCKRRLVEGMLQ